MTLTQCLWCLQWPVTFASCCILDPFDSPNSDIFSYSINRLIYVMEILSVYCQAFRSFLAYSSSLNNKIRSKTLVKILYFHWRPFGISGLSNLVLNRVIFYCSCRLAVSFRKEMFLYFVCQSWLQNLEGFL